MGLGFARHQLVYGINEAFKPSSIEATAATAAELPDEADAYQIVDKLNLFQFPAGMNVESYRASLGIPPLNDALLNLAFKTAVREKIPLSFAVVSGEVEQVLVTTSTTQITVVLMRKT